MGLQKFQFGASVFVLYVGYALFVWNRKSFQFVIPFVSKENHLTDIDIGFIVSCQSFGYTCSKLLTGIVAGNFNPELFFSVLLLITGLVCFIFSLFSNVWLLAFLWTIAGLVQGASWPCVAKILQSWVPSENFGTWWAIVSTSMNVPGTIGPVLALYIGQQYHWRMNVVLFSIASFVFSFVSFAFLRRGQLLTLAKKTVDKSNLSMVKWSSLVFHPLSFTLHVLYANITLLRFAIVDWGPLFLTQDRGFFLTNAGGFLSALELGGLFGQLIAGWLSDQCVRASYSHSNWRNPRLTVIISMSTIGITAFLILVSLVDADWSVISVSILGAALGLGIYGPTAVLGPFAMEAVPSPSSITSHAVTTLFANMGGMLAGLPVTWLAQKLGWSVAFYMLCALLMLNVLIAYCLRNNTTLKDEVEGEKRKSV